ncbi:MAG: transporter substrate-binding domain-containing protein [Oscillospiraceae bacterium]|nr:transporter substrate-binding domain-containing protein [Oscillospiraceae bacterium]
MIHHNRKQKMTVSVCILILALCLLAGCGLKEATPVTSSDPVNGTDVTLDSLNGKRFGVESGTVSDLITLERLPDAKISWFNTIADLTVALKTGKIDAFTADDAVIRLCAAEDEQLALVPEFFDSVDFAFAFPKTEKGAALRNEFNAFLADLKASGEFDRIQALWTGSDTDAKTVPPPETLPAENGMLSVATFAAYAPFEYYHGSQLFGYEIDLAFRFCESYGYGLKIADMNFDSVMASVQTGKCDFAVAGITVTPERAENVLFSDSIYQGGSAVCVLKNASSEKSGFLSSIENSLEKTFIRENRWQLFLRGVGTTMLITVLVQQILLPRMEAPGIHVLIRCDAQAASTAMTVSYGGEAFDPKETDNGLSYTVLKNTAAEMAYAFDVQQSLPNRVELLIT